MTRQLNLDDIQGNVTRAYGKFSFPFARYFFLHIDRPADGRKFLAEVRKQVTTAARWNDDDCLKPITTMNVALSFLGMLKLRISAKTLQAFPPEFIEGMRARAFVLGDRDTSKVEDDTDASWCAHWDKIWQENRKPFTLGTPTDVHMWLSINAQSAGEENPFEPHGNLEKQTQWLRDLCEKTCNGRVRILATNGKSGKDEYQSASAVFDKYGDTIVPTAKEHFGLTDGIGDPVFEGQYTPETERAKVRGRGKWMSADRGYEGWEPLATGEFILGHPDESQELPPATLPVEFMRNGTFMAYRKLHENVETFDKVINEQAKAYAKEMNVSQEEAVETLKAKMVGRWTDGVPLSKVPTYDAWKDFRAANGFSKADFEENPWAATAKHLAYIGSNAAVDFKYGDDMQGTKCPATSHLRRVNTRDYLDPTNDVDGDNPQATTQLNKRRRILRRGLPYGPSNFEKKNDDTEQGVAMMLLGASIFRQFEFVQQQWIQYGMDFHAGNNTCPVLGDHTNHDRHTVPQDPDTGKAPFVMQLGKKKNFVDVRGGEYFFIPSMTSLRMMAMGTVDPT